MQKHGYLYSVSNWVSAMLFVAQVVIVCSRISTCYKMDEISQNNDYLHVFHSFSQLHHHYLVLSASLYQWTVHTLWQPESKRHRWTAHIWESTTYNISLNLKKKNSWRDFEKEVMVYFQFSGSVNRLKFRIPLWSIAKQHRKKTYELFIIALIRKTKPTKKH